MQSSYSRNHKTDRAFALECCDNLKHNFGVDLVPILTDDSLSLARRRSKALRVLLEAAVNRADESEDRAEWASPPGVDESAFLKAVAEETEVDIEPNISYPEANFAYLKNLQGTALKDFLYSTAKRFENMANAKTPAALAIDISIGGMMSVGVPMAVGTYQAMRAGQTLVAALRTSITNLGMKTAVAFVVAVLVALLLYLILENPKKCLGMVCNNTDSNLVVSKWRNGVDGGGDSNLYMEHGAMKSYMEDYEGGILTKQVQINARFFFEKGDKDNAFFAGIYFAEKNAGFYGAMGVMVFTGLPAGARFAHLFACPYTENNGANVAISGSLNIEALYEELYRTRNVRVQRTSSGYNMTATVDDARGGIIGCMATIEKA
jgi:hypothetical protein